LKVEDNVQSITIPNFSYVPSSSMSNPFNNVENRKKNKHLQYVPLLPNFDNSNTITSYSRIEIDNNLLQESCIGVLNDKAKLVEST
jgi:hypothetical protein